MSTTKNSIQTHEKLLSELRSVIENATLMLAYTEHYSSDNCKDARKRLALTLDMAKIELATFEAAQLIRNSGATPAIERVTPVFSGENTVFRAFK